MGVMETKVIQVRNDPEEINRSNEEWGRFGWSVLSIQVTHSQNTKTYTKGFDYYTGDKTVETTTINYATITYQRDKEGKNYSRFAELEKEYQSLRDYCVSQKMPSRKSGTKSYKWGFILLLLIWPVGLVYLAYVFYCNNIKSAPEAEKEYEKEVEAYKREIQKKENRMKEILHEADQLMVI